MPIPSDKPPVTLVGVNGNAHAIIAAARKAARLAGWTDTEIAEFVAEAKAGDYDHLMQTCMKYFDVM
jgi:hypothetical protein